MTGGRQQARDAFGTRLAAHWDRLAPAGRRVAQYIDQNRATALASSTVTIARHAATSDATVVRAVQAMGFAGIAEMKQALAAAIGGRFSAAENMRRTLADVGDSAAGAVQMVLAAHRDAVAALSAPASCASLNRAVEILHAAERVVVFGIGPSAPLAAYTATQLARSGRRSRALDVTGGMLADQLLDLHAGDVILALAYGTPSREVMALSAEALRLGLALVLITDTPRSRLARTATLAVAVQRGRSDRVALHGTTLVALEALVLGLAAANQPAALRALQRLNRLRDAIA